MMGYNPSNFVNCGPSCPVDSLLWREAAAFCNALSKKRGLEECFDCTGEKDKVQCKPKTEFSGKNYYKCKGYRLPTEAEWEYAYRAGTTSALHNGPLVETSATSLCHAPEADPISWHCGNSRVSYQGCVDRTKYGGTDCDGTHPVGHKKPNGWGLFDISGNLYELVFDWCGPGDGKCASYLAEDQTDPVGPATGKDRGARGGSWATSPFASRAANRGWNTFDVRGATVGLRVARTLPK